FVAKFTADGSALVYSTYLGGNTYDYGFGIAVDAAGDAYVTGDTASTNFPTANAVQPVFGGVEDAFVAKLTAGGMTLAYSTYLGGSGVDYGQGIAVAPTGAAYVAGSTDSKNFPVTASAFQTPPGGGDLSDAFVTKLTPSGSALAYATYLGG